MWFIKKNKWLFVFISFIVFFFVCYTFYSVNGYIEGATSKPPTKVTTKPPTKVTTKPPTKVTTKPPKKVTTKPPTKVTTKPPKKALTTNMAATNVAATNVAATNVAATNVAATSITKSPKCNINKYVTAEYADLPQKCENIELGLITKDLINRNDISTASDLLKGLQNVYKTETPNNATTGATYYKYIMNECDGKVGAQKCLSQITPSTIIGLPFLNNNDYTKLYSLK